MATALDARINEWSARLTDLRRRAAEMEREASVIEIRLEAFREARALIEGDAAVREVQPRQSQAGVVPNGLVTIDDDVPMPRQSRLSSQWRSLLAYAFAEYPEAVTNNQFSAEADRLGSPMPRDNLRSALWTHTKNGLFEKVGTGVYRITDDGADIIGKKLPKSFEAESVERIPAPPSAPHEPPLEGPIRQIDVHSVEEAAHKPVEPVLGGGTWRWPAEVGFPHHL